MIIGVFWNKRGVTFIYIGKAFLQRNLCVQIENIDWQSKGAFTTEVINIIRDGPRNKVEMSLFIFLQEQKYDSFPWPGSTTH